MIGWIGYTSKEIFSKRGCSINDKKTGLSNFTKNDIVLPPKHGAQPPFNEGGVGTVLWREDNVDFGEI